MFARSVPEPPEAVEADALLAPAFELEGDARPDDRLEMWSGRRLADAYGGGEFRGRVGETILFHQPVGLKAKRLLVYGAGKSSAAGAFEMRRAAGAAARRLKGAGARRLAAVAPAGDARLVQALVEAATLADFEADLRKTSGRTEGRLEELLITGAPDARAVERGLILGESQNFARDLINAPANLLPPRLLAERAQEMAAAVGLEAEVLGPADLEEQGFGALLAVARGSAEEPRLIVLRYRPDGAGDVPPALGLIGKGVTFDTGGISIKPAADMDRMRYDMAGGAAAISAMRALALLKPAIPVAAVIPASENMPDGRALRPGDVITTLSGKTVEVLNTDAEGRLLLADALTYARRLGCRRLVDAATLTGSIVVALGRERIGLFSNDAAWQDRVRETGEVAGERMWPMPMDDDYKEQLKTPFADLPNIGGRWGGSITAALFLKEFADPTPWAHLDIAGTAWLDQDKPYLPKGATGVAVRTFAELALGLED